MSSIISICLITVALAVGFHHIRQYWSAKHINRPYPPGPNGTFWAGNLKDVPKEKGWLTYTSWKKQYGDLIHLRIFGQHVVIVNSRNDAAELFEKRSKMFSDRPYIASVKMMGWDFNTVFQSYTDEWKRHRKLYHQFLRPQESVAYLPVQTSKVNDMLKDLLTAPEKFVSHYRKLSGAIIMKVIYNIDVAPENDFYVDLADKTITKLGEAILPGAMLVNSLPFLRYIPSWVPGANFKRRTQEIKEMTEKMIIMPFEFAQKYSDSLSSVTMQLLADSRSSGGTLKDECTIRHVCATSYAGGADTTVSAVGTFFYAMTIYPEVQKRAQKEIEEVTGNARLPSFEDRESLPYVDAIYREVLRWRPVLPLGIAHATSADCIYKGYLIPKGATVIPNAWAMSYDEDIYPNPEEFRPERYFKEDGQLNHDISEHVFGFGRRICPGRHMASSTVWLAIVTVLATFNITKAKDEGGNEIPVSGEYTDGLLSHPVPYQCSIVPRSERARELIEGSVEQAVCL